MFPEEPLASYLTKNFVEVRLHTDLKPTNEGYAEFHEQIQELRVHFIGAGNTSVPQYFIVDPAEPRVAIVAKRNGIGGYAEGFRALFEAALNR